MRTGWIVAEEILGPLRELADLWLAPDADALHRVLVLERARRLPAADTFEPMALLSKHHKTEPATSIVTATLLLTDRRWKNAVGKLVRAIAESSILDHDELDLLAQTFLAAERGVYWQIPDAWVRDGVVVIVDLGEADDGDDERNEPEPAEPGRPVAWRPVYPPLRRWAAAWTVAREPAAWAAVRARAKELDARDAAAVVSGLLDALGALPPATQELLLGEGTTWPDQSVRRLALGLVAERRGLAAAYELARDDRSATIRSWAATLVGEQPAGGRPRSRTVDEPPSLF